MTKPSIEVEGAKELRRALKQIDSGTADLKKVHADAAAVVEQAAGTFVPRRSGRLAGSIRSTGQAGAGVVRAGKAAIPYAGPIHFGWAAHNIAPQPFLYDALDQRRDEVIALYEDAVDKLIKDNGLQGGVG